MTRAPPRRILCAALAALDGAYIAVAEYCPDRWLEGTRLLIRRMAPDPAQVSTNPRSRRRRTLQPDRRALPFDKLADAGAIYAYSFIMTNPDVSTPDVLAAAPTMPSCRSSPGWQAGRHGTGRRSSA